MDIWSKNSNKNPFSWFSREEPPPWWSSYTGYSRKEDLHPSIIEWLNWPPAVFTVYILSVFAVISIAYSSFIWITEKYKKKHRRGRRRQAHTKPDFSQTAEADLSTSEILPAPSPEKVWSKGPFGRPHEEDAVARQSDDSTISKMPGEKPKPTEAPRPPITQATCENCAKIKYHRVEFRWYEKASKVFLTGSFLKWSSLVEMTYVLDSFFVCFDLPRGHHEFKFQVDGIWRHSETYPIVKSLVGEERNFIHEN